MYLIIESSDSYGEKSKEKVSCQKEVTPRGIKYSYENEYGNCKIFVLKDMVQITRKGAINSVQVFKDGKVTPFHYKTPYTISEFNLKTTEMKHKKEGFFLSYEIYDGEEKINDIEISIKEVWN
ncbi:DUF1934 domain-containing protein [uncultured Ilyobacter sp.]|uniref:DUF1934 domain-containing protein n=1 Tax=uncultured Ilyobacter sp. TaxID=544433 RepID=UPI0029C652F1|nr:DUF1934 domain-containing protein [uncultured Ilyobacter sp.]